MFIAMNRFKVALGSERPFEEHWLARESHLEEMPGFVEFHLLRGPERDDHRLYSSHTLWLSRGHFEAWTRSEEFRASHARAGDSRAAYLGHPEFEGFDVIQTLSTPARTVRAAE